MKNKSKKLFITFYILLGSVIVVTVLTTLLSPKLDQHNNADSGTILLYITTVLLWLSVATSIIILILAIVFKVKEKKQLKNEILIKSIKFDNIQENNNQKTYREKFCTYCGGKINDTDKKCPNCGATIKN